MVRTSTKMYSTTLTDFDMCHRVEPLRMLIYFVTLNYFSRSNISNTNISENVRASTKMLRTAFINSDICH